MSLKFSVYFKISDGGSGRNFLTLCHAQTSQWKFNLRSLRPKLKVPPPVLGRKGWTSFQQGQMLWISQRMRIGRASGPWQEGGFIKTSIRLCPKMHTGINHICVGHPPNMWHKLVNPIIKLYPIFISYSIPVYHRYMANLGYPTKNI
jgi:hypothetical protein